MCTGLQFDKKKEWPSIVGEHFDFPQPKFDFRTIDKSFDKMGCINYEAYSLTIPPEHLRLTQVCGLKLVTQNLTKFLFSFIFGSSFIYFFIVSFGKVIYVSYRRLIVS